MMRRLHVLCLTVLLQLAVISPVSADANPGDVALYDNDNFAIGIGAAVVRIDTKFKVTDKQSGDSVFLDPEGNLDLPEISHVTIFYVAYIGMHFLI